MGKCKQEFMQDTKGRCCTEIQLTVTEKLIKGHKHSSQCLLRVTVLELLSSVKGSLSSETSKIHLRTI